MVFTQLKDYPFKRFATQSQQAVEPAQQPPHWLRMIQRTFVPTPELVGLAQRLMPAQQLQI